MLNSVRAVTYDVKINPDKDTVCVDGKEILYKEHVYIMLNKPQGVVCSTRDGLSPTVLSLIPENLNRKGLFPAGRLDKDTEGFVLITDDGELAHRMLAPKSHVPKLYYVMLESAVGDNYKERFNEGITLKSGEKCLPAGFIADEESDRACQVILHEGMFHQVKRMFEALDNSVVFLKRIRIGSLNLDPNLLPGECKEIMHKDVEKLLERPVLAVQNI